LLGSKRLCSADRLSIEHKFHLHPVWIVNHLPMVAWLEEARPKGKGQLKWSVNYFMTLAARWSEIISCFARIFFSKDLKKLSQI
jgi:hypothetical protein